jgi:hypothetical protein
MQQNNEQLCRALWAHQIECVRCSPSVEQGCHIVSHMFLQPMLPFIVDRRAAEASRVAQQDWRCKIPRGGGRFIIHPVLRSMWNHSTHKIPIFPE